jgi:four helix bundle protein
MVIKFEKLEVWQQSLEYVDFVYAIVRLLPSNEEQNLISQLRRAVTSINLNIAEGSTQLLARLTAMLKTLIAEQKTLRELDAIYTVEAHDPSTHFLSET